MLNVIHGFQDQEQGVVVPLQLGPVVCVHGVFDGQPVQPERLGYRLHLMFVGFVQAHPDEPAIQRAHLFQRGVRGVLARQPHSVHVDAAVDDGPGERHRDAFGIGFWLTAANGGTQRRRGDRRKSRHDVGSLFAYQFCGTVLRDGNPRTCASAWKADVVTFDIARCSVCYLRVVITGQAVVKDFPNSMG
ncbi:Uncharacterised protein [Mycobacteroides abscessus subsp. abscessus]|nr:Uncharacterised protein [Mycobacteroides abscessus subsp. abscessus]